MIVRVSTDRQAKEGDSLEEQEAELRKFCDYRGFQIRNVLIEKGKSGGNTNRPEYKKLIKDIKAQKINAVVVKKLDRLSRSLMDFEQLTILLQEKEVEFISLKENFDTTNALGKAMLRVALVFAQLEREQTGERIKDVFAYRAKQGQYNGGLRPYGYESVNAELVVNKQEAKIVEFMFRTFIDTKSTTMATREMNSMGFRNRKGDFWDKRQVHKMLKRPVYKGYIKWEDTLHQGIHQAIVTETTFKKVQQIFEDQKTVSPRNKIKGLLKGFIICGICNSYLSPNYTKKKSGKKYEYYRCVATFNPGYDCSGQYIPLEQTHEQVFEELLSYSTEARLSLMQKDIERHNSIIQKDITALETRTEKLSAQLEKVKEKKEKYLDSLITGDFSGRERKIINDKIDEFSLQEKQLDSERYKNTFDSTELKDQLVTIDDFKESVIKLKVNYKSMSDEDLRQWLKENVEQIIINGEKVKVTFKKLKLQL